jgi:hypothetical protein
VFENRVLRRIFGTMKEEEKLGLRKFLNEELHNLYFSPNIIRVYDLELLRRLCIIKSSRASSRVKWLNGEKNQSFEDHLRTEVAGVPIRVSTLRTRMEMVLDTLVFSPFNHLMRLVDRENFIIRVFKLRIMGWAGHIASNNEIY